MPKTPNAKSLPVSELKWNKAACRYTRTDGKFVSQARVEVVLEQNIDAIGEKMDELIEDLIIVGALGIDFWERQMRRLIKNLHLQNAALAQGGFHNITQAGYGRAGYQIKYNYGRLNNFAQQMRNNPAMLTPAKANYLTNRVGLYAQNGRTTYSWVQQKAHIDNGFNFVENILEPEAVHCHTTSKAIGCPELTEKGRMPINEFVQIGSRQCGPGCKCRARYFKTLKDD